MTSTTKQRELLFSVTLDDCEVQHFRSGGKGGQHQNKTDSGTRIIHHPSGARGESREERSQLQNKKLAFKRMAHHPLFQWWVHAEAERIRGNESAEARVDRMLTDQKQIRVEVKDVNGRWVELPSETPPATERIHVRGDTVSVVSKQPAR
jgi:protein subunit release factor B